MRTRLPDAATVNLDAPLNFEIDAPLADKLRMARAAIHFHERESSGNPPEQRQGALDTASAVDADTVDVRTMGVLKETAGGLQGRPASTREHDDAAAMIAELRAIAMAAIETHEGIPHPYAVEVTHLTFGAQDSDTSKDVVAHLDDRVGLSKADPGAGFSTSYRVHERDLVIRDDALLRANAHEHT